LAGGEQTSSSGIAGRIVRAAGAQGMIQVVRVMQLFLLVPVCLGAWGTAVYEDWVLLYSITAFLVLADLGLVQFTAVRLIDAWSKGERERFSQEWALALGIFGALTGALMGVLGVALTAPGWTSLIPAHQEGASSLAAIAVLLSLAQVWSILIFLGLAAYRARGDLSRSYHMWSILVALQTAGIGLPAWLGYGPTGSAAGNCLATGVTLAGVVVDFCWRYSDMTWKPIWPRLADLWRRVWDAIGYLLSPVATTIILNGPNLILAQSGAPEGAIAVFTATRTIAGVARQLPYQFAHPAGVELAGLLARGDNKHLSRVYVSASRALAVVVGVLSGFTVVAAPLVMTLWTRGKVVYDPEVMLLLVGATAVCAPAQVAYTLLWYAGYPGRLNKALIFSTGLSVGLAILLAPHFGAAGVAAGLGIGETAGIAVYLSLLVDRLLQRKPGTALWRNFWTASLSFLGSAAVGYLLDFLLKPSGWLGLIELGFVWSIPAAAIVYWIFLSGPQQDRVTAAAANFLRSRRA
jgi:O-antigen/teichoic acid export membrane protein